MSEPNIQPVGRNHCSLLVSVLEGDQSLNGQIKMASQEQSVREFVAVTGVDEERARFFLESAGWSLHVGFLWALPFC